MGRAIPREQPAVELPSPHWTLRGLLAVAAIAVLGLGAALVIPSGGEDAVKEEKVAAAKSTSTSMEQRWSEYDDAVKSLSSGEAAAAFSVPKAIPETRYDGGPEEGTRGPITSPQPGTRYDGGPEEGSRGIARTSDVDRYLRGH